MIDGTACPLTLLANTYRAFYGGFTTLHPIQKAAIAPILGGLDLVVQSATGSGKTEAVLAPVLERVIRSGRTEAVLYVVPTRALAVDLERRLFPILGPRLGLQFGIRTGDLKRPGGVRPDLILTTPESLDVLLGSANLDLAHFVRRVRMVIIDEVHPLLCQYRGRQLAYLLKRLERRAGTTVQRIALSATIAEIGAVIDFFGLSPTAVRLVSAVQREIVPHLALIKNDTELLGLLDDLKEIWGYQKILLFAKSRGQCDRIFALTSRKGCFRGLAELHYSNLKPRERRTVEERFRRQGQSLCIATSTLELGIDIGDVDAVLLHGPPDSVSAFLQRIGRANRRERSTHFWGICRGERANEELLRFLALLRLARDGVLETPLPNLFPSVLVQQIISCLYEKKRITLSALNNLFSEQTGILAELFPALERQGWLRRDRSITRIDKFAHFPGADAASLGMVQRSRFKGSRLGSWKPPSSKPGTVNVEPIEPCPSLPNGLFRGGWRYRRGFLTRSIWSNFPEAEEEYLLEIASETVADLPRSIVRQLEIGDCVHLAGKGIRIMEINDSGERKRVRAELATELDYKELYWLGAGIQIPFELAQAMRKVLDRPEEVFDTPDLGLFARTRRLLDEEREKNQRIARLKNGIEVLKIAGLFHYRTFLGSLGNLILCFAIEAELGREDKASVTSDEIGIICSQWVEFEKLSLPINQDGFRRWIGAHLRLLRTLLPLNAFADSLPKTLLVEELLGFLYDPRVAEHFGRYLSTSSEIAEGDLDGPDLPGTEPRGGTEVFLAPSPSVSLLAAEKERRAAGVASQVLLPAKEGHHVPRPVTGAMINEYLRLEQCERWFGLHFLPPDQQPEKPAGLAGKLEKLRTERRRQHEKGVLAHLAATGATLIRIGETDRKGRNRSLAERFRETLDCLASLALRSNSGRPAYIYQAVIIVPSLLLNHFDERISGRPSMDLDVNEVTVHPLPGPPPLGEGAEGNPCESTPQLLPPAGGGWEGGKRLFGEKERSLLARINGIGIPDLLRVSGSPSRPQLEGMDIKDSPRPYFSQKWQVAFHALLLAEAVRNIFAPAELKVADQGFLILRGKYDPAPPLLHPFGLAPFLAAFPALFQNLSEILLEPPAQAEFRLKTHCPGCPFFVTCYQGALREEEIQFLPHLSRGTLSKLRQLGLRRLADAAGVFCAGNIEGPDG